MCLILFACEAHPKYRLILAANRDEFYDRPTRPAGFWEDAPHVLAGRDLQIGGTWLGVTRQGRMAAVTNYRDPASVRAEAESRGILVSRFLLENTPSEAYLRKVERKKDAFNGFNLLAGDRDGLFWFSNRGKEVRPVPPGVHGLSNRLLDTPWPKVRRGITRFKAAIGGPETEIEERLFSLLTDRHRPPDGELPETGVGLEWERILSPIFIQSPVYGTRSSTVILAKPDGQAVFVEQTFLPGGPSIRKGPTRRFVLEGPDPNRKD